MTVFEKKRETVTFLFIVNFASILGLTAESQDLRNLYLEGKDFDLRIYIGEKEFKVLRKILKDRAPVFANVLFPHGAGNPNSVVTIDAFDACDSTAFHHFLLYIYTGEIKELYEKNVYGLYCAASMFQMPDLKEACTNLLHKYFSVGTIIDIF